MRIKLSKRLPSVKELSRILNDRFSDSYSVKTFGMGGKNILIGKSTLVGAEVSVDKNEVSISWSPPSVFGGILLSLGLSELIILLLPFLVRERFSPNTSYRKMEKEIGTFLYSRYN